MVKVAQNDPMWPKIADIVPDNLDNPKWSKDLVSNFWLKKWVILSESNMPPPFCKTCARHPLQ